MARALDARIAMTPSGETCWQRVRTLLRTHSVRRGDFLLVSGRRSSVYVDAKLTTCRAAAMPLIGRLFIDKMIELGWRPAAVGGLSIGADPIVTAVARESLEYGLNIDSFLVRKEPKKHGLQKYLEGLDQATGLDVVIVDDVCSTGGSTITAIERSREAGLNVLGAICLVDREMGAEQAIREGLGCPFDRIFRLRDLLEEDEPAGVVPATASAGVGIDR